MFVRGVDEIATLPIADRQYEDFVNANMKTTSSNVIGAGPSPFIVRLTPTVPRGALISNDIRVGGVRVGKGKR